VNPLVIAGGVAIFVVLALLLLSLNLASLWRWWIKAGAIVVTLSGIIVLYLAMAGLIGWPSTEAMPKRFSLLSTRIVEPDKLRGLPGHIYLWIEEVDEHQIVISPPRAFEVPYEVETATDVATAQEQVNTGGKVLGQFAATSSEVPTRPANAQALGDAKPKDIAVTTDRKGGAGGEGAETIGDPGMLTFSEMPPVDLPDKGDMVQQMGQ
jgi:hypothetical protein